MSCNSFGDKLRITTFGESHGEAIGVVIDGCPAGLTVSENEINLALSLRAPGGNKYVSARKESDKGMIISGMFNDKTTGTPIAVIIKNSNFDSSKYEPIKNCLRPGHANYTYLQKYGVFDYRGGGRASARETASRVVAAVFAKKILEKDNIVAIAFVKSIGCIVANPIIREINELKQKTFNSKIFCPDEKVESSMKDEIESVKASGDSIGGIVEFIVAGVPTGLGDPVYGKLSAKLANAMMSIPAAKGFEIGVGFNASRMKGSECNDAFISDIDNITLASNNSGGILGGISTGMELVGRVAFKPTSSIMQPQKTVDLHGNEVVITLPDGSMHDPCIAIRAVPVVESMCALVIADLLLQK